MNRLVSVVIPTYNRAHVVTRAIDSVLSQTHRDLEVIVVDDGSTDDTEKVLTTRYAHDSRVSYVRQENQGVCSARNTGLRNINGAYVALLDSDDLWKPWKLELQLAALEAIPDAGMVWTDMEAIGPDGHVIKPNYLHTMYGAYKWFPAERLFSAQRTLPAALAGAASGTLTVWSGDIYSAMIFGNLVHTSTVLLRRERIDQVGLFDVSLQRSGEDYDFHLRTCREGPVAFIDVSSISYQVGMPDQLTAPEFSIYLARNFLTTVSKYLELDRDRLRPDPALLRQKLAETHYWLGEAELDCGNNRRARQHLCTSLRHEWRQPRVQGLLVTACLPTPLTRLVRNTVHAARVRLNKSARLKSV
jgi:glycosyltransferase involved in cell wall biosynthesis